jgi:MoxR-like ATPase
MQQEALSVAVAANVPVILWGSPGIGKTKSLEKLAEKMGEPIETVLASIREPSDFSGLPIIHGKSVAMAPPNWAERLVEYGRGILFFDEISTAAPAVQSALLRVILDRVVGDIKLPDAVRIVAAANPPEVSAGGWDLSPPLANRFCHLSWEWDKDKQDRWIDGMINGWDSLNYHVHTLPEGWEKTVQQTQIMIASFIKFHSQLGHVVPKESSNLGKAWPSPRAWTVSARLIAACEAVSASDATVLELVQGCVGDAAALEFLNWKRKLDLPDPEELLKNPKKFKLPKSGDQQFAVLSSVGFATMGRPTKDRIEACWDILNMALEAGAADIASASARSLAGWHMKNMKKKINDGGEKTESFPIPHDKIENFFPILQEAGIL